MVLTEKDAKSKRCFRTMHWCLGSECMAWVFLAQKYGEEADYSGRVCEVALPREGYCGLVYPKPLSTSEGIING